VCVCGCAFVCIYVSCLSAERCSKFAMANIRDMRDECRAWPAPRSVAASLRDYALYNQPLVYAFYTPIRHDIIYKYILYWAFLAKGRPGLGLEGEGECVVCVALVCNPRLIGWNGWVMMNE
jgi:hypothetical protein